jgi:hypothetical protein
MPVNPTGLLSRPATAAFVERARSIYDLVVFDSPPLGRLADAAILAAVSDASIVVVRGKQSTKSDLQRAVSALGRAPAPVAGVVMLEERSRYLANYPHEPRTWWPPNIDPRPLMETLTQKFDAIQKQRTASRSRSAKRRP